MADVPEPLSQAKEAWLEELKARWKHPLGGAYLFAWVVWNHQFLMVVLSGEPYKERLKDVAAFSDPSLLGVLNHFGVPLLVAAVYIALAPWSSVVQTFAMGVAENTLRKVRSWFGTQYFSPEDVAKLRESDRLETQALRSELQAAATQMTEISMGTSKLRELALEIFLAKLEADGQTPVDFGPHRISTSFDANEKGLDNSLARHVETKGLNDLHLMILAYLRAERKLSALVNECRAPKATAKPFCYALGYLFNTKTISVTWLSGSEPTLKITSAGTLLIEGLVAQDPNAPFIT